MLEQSQSRRTRFGLAAGVLSPLLLWGLLLDAYVPWGDDWAGYLLQARALVSGAPERELVTNATVISLSDVFLGPYAYPWGYPAMLAVVGPLVDWDNGLLKIIGAASLACLSVASYRIARRRLGSLSALAMTFLATTQVSVIEASLALLSDLPYTAVAMVALDVADGQFLSTLANRPTRRRETAMLAMLCVAAFAIRPNGAVLPVAFVGANVFATLFLGADPHVMLRRSVWFGLLVGAGMSLYFNLLPDGSLMHAGALSMDPRVWMSRAQDHVGAILQVLPGGALSSGIALFGVLAMIALLYQTMKAGQRQKGLAAVRRGGLLIPILMYVSGHLALLTMFRGNTQGMRYYVSIVSPLLLLFALAAKAVLESTGGLGEARSERRRLLVAVGVVVVCLATSFSTATSLLARRGTRDLRTAPYSEATQRMTQLVASLPADLQVAFRKPRALRYLTHRTVLAVSRPENLPLVDVYVWELGSTEADQVTEAQLSAAGFIRAGEVPPFRVYEASRNSHHGKISVHGYHD